MGCCGVPTGPWGAAKVLVGPRGAVGCWQVPGVQRGAGAFFWGAGRSVGSLWGAGGSLYVAGKSPWCYGVLVGPCGVLAGPHGAVGCWWVPVGCFGVPTRPQGALSYHLHVPRVRWAGWGGATHTPINPPHPVPTAGHPAGYRQLLLQPTTSAKVPGNDPASPGGSPAAAPSMPGSCDRRATRPPCPTRCPPVCPPLPPPVPVRVVAVPLPASSASSPPNSSGGEERGCGGGGVGGHVGLSSRVPWCGGFSVCVAPGLPPCIPQGSSVCPLIPAFPPPGILCVSPLCCGCVPSPPSPPHHCVSPHPPGHPLCRPRPSPPKLCVPSFLPGILLCVPLCVLSSSSGLLSVPLSPPRAPPCPLLPPPRTLPCPPMSLSGSYTSFPCPPTLSAGWRWGGFSVCPLVPPGSCTSPLCPPGLLLSPRSPAIPSGHPPPTTLLCPLLSVCVPPPAPCGKG